MQVLDIMKEVGWRWKVISDSERNYFSKKSDLDKNWYDAEYKDYHFKLNEMQTRINLKIQSMPYEEEDKSEKSVKLSISEHEKTQLSLLSRFES